MNHTVSGEILKQMMFYFFLNTRLFIMPNNQYSYTIKNEY